MNVAFFLIPKKDVVFLNKNSTIRQALERMEFHGYAAVPLIDSEGRYAGTLTEGDLLWNLKNTCDFSFENAEKIRLSQIKLRTQ
ncbi:MAG: CBS domain-containing protein, partial [Eubacteriales bacterium]